MPFLLAGLFDLPFPPLEDVDFFLPRDVEADDGAFAAAPFADFPAIDADAPLAAEGCLLCLSTGGAFLLCVLFLCVLFLDELLLRLEERLLLDAPEGVETGRLWADDGLSNSAKKSSISSRFGL